MKSFVKISILAITAGILTTGCFGCGDGDKGGNHGIIDTLEMLPKDSSKKTIDTTAKAKVNTIKKDTSKKK